ncbi:MAG: paraquat-inducible protein A [Glaciecola sp.]
MKKRHLGFAINLLALALFFPGILLPMITLDMEMAANLSGSAFVTELLNKELSIIATVQDLWADERLLVAVLIFAFSVCIPVAKTSLVSIAYFQKNAASEQRILRFVTGIGKWSMADVFVVAIFLAVLSTNHANTAQVQEFSVFGLSFAVEVSTQTLSAVGQGFYCFTAYCLLSLAGTQLYLHGVEATKR